MAASVEAIRAESTLRVDFTKVETLLWSLIRLCFLGSLIFSILNISINGNSFYFYLILPFFDLPFLRWLYRLKFRHSTIAFLIFLTGSLLLQTIHGGAAKYISKPIWLALVVAYAYFLRNQQPKLFRAIYIFCSISIGFAIIQLWSVFAGLQELFYPTSIAKMIWGNLAITARPGFEDGIIFPIRVAGLSKEPGFFSSQLLVVFILLVKDSGLSKRSKAAFSSLFIFGVFLAFSKITLVFIFPTLIAYIIKKAFFPLEKIPLPLGIAAFLLAFMIFTKILYEYVGLISASYIIPYFVETYLHRTIGYYLLNKANNEIIFDIFAFGGATQRINDILTVVPFLHNLNFVRRMPEVVFFSSCISYLAIQYSAFFLFFYTLFLRSIKVNFFDFLIFTLAISSINPLALENFVILGYLVLIPSPGKSVPWLMKKLKFS